MAMGFRGPGVFRDIFSSEMPSNSPYVLNVQSAPTQAPAMPNVMSNLDGMQAGQGFAPSKPSFFGQGGTGRQIIGIIGDALSVAGGGKPVYAPAMMDMREQAAKERMWMMQEQAKAQQDAQERKAKMADWVTQQQWSRDNPQPTALMQNDAFLRQNHGDRFADDYLMKPTFVQNWDGTHSQAGGGAASGPPVGAIDDLRKNPALAKDFDEAYGSGAAARILGGGAGGNASGNFPR